MTGDRDDLGRRVEGPEQWLGAPDPVETFGSTIERALQDLSVELAGIRAERDGLRLELEGLRTQLEVTQKRLADRDQFTATVRELSQVVQRLNVPTSWTDFPSAPPPPTPPSPDPVTHAPPPAADPIIDVPPPPAPPMPAVEAVYVAPSPPAAPPIPDPVVEEPAPFVPASEAFADPAQDRTAGAAAGAYAMPPAAEAAASPAPSSAEPTATASPTPDPVDLAVPPAPAAEPAPASSGLGPAAFEPGATAPTSAYRAGSAFRPQEAAAESGLSLLGTEDRFFDQPGVWLGEPPKRAPRLDGLKVWARRIGVGLIGLIVVAVLLVSVGPKFLPYQTYFVRSGSMSPTFDTGDLIVLGKTDANDIEERDIITFERPDRPGTLVTHRVVAVERSDTGGLQFQTKGDANAQRDAWRVPATGTGWKYSFRIPKVGYLVGYLGTAEVRLAMLAIPAVLLGLLSLLDIWKAPTSARRRR